MITAIFLWLDQHPIAYWAGAGLSSVLLLAWSGYRLRSSSDSPTQRDWLFAPLLFAFLLSWRWPFLFSASEYNPDESQFVAGALTLAHDPVFWRSVDGSTSGPINFYVLLPWQWLGLPMDYFAVRMVGLLLVAAMLLGLRHLFRTLAPTGIATVAVLPVAVFCAVVFEPDFVHYSSELASLALLALAAACSPRRPLVAACVAGALPWAKLQAAPLAAVLVAWQIALIARDPMHRRQRWRRGGMLVAAAAAPSLLIIGLVLVFGQWAHFFRRYVLQNFLYTGGGGRALDVLQTLWQQANYSRLFTTWTCLSLVTVLVAGGCYVRRRQKPSRTFWLGALLSVAAAFSILLPARPSLHYFLFMTAPLAIWTGAALCDFATTVMSRRILVVLTIACALALLGIRLTRPVPDMIGQLAAHWRQPRTALPEVLRFWRDANARLVVWGWSNHLYAESGLPQGARDMPTIWSMLPSPLREYHRATLLEDFRRNEPELFVDAVGTNATFFQDRAALGHETFPELAAAVAERYDYVLELGPARLYVRKDFLAAHPLGRDKLKLVRLGRSTFDDARPPDEQIAATAPQLQIDGTWVRLLEPATELRWRLSGDEREVLVRFGFDPRGYREGNTDGADLIVELRMPGQPALTVGHRLLEPKVNRGDRERPLFVRANLPPYPRGTQLVVRAGPGKKDDTTDDRIYFDRLHFVTSPVYLSQQFPHFTRPPDEVDAVYPHLMLQRKEWVLMMPPPATLTFVLDGSERHAGLTYGLAEGAYTGGGDTDGVGYRLELHRNNAPPLTLFHRYLNPLKETADRGRQESAIDLPADVRPGDRLMIKVEPGSHTSWDWSYLAAFHLQ